jgi:hypothetical protein
MCVCGGAGGGSPGADVRGGSPAPAQMRGCVPHRGFRTERPQHWALTGYSRVLCGGTLGVLEGTLKGHSLPAKGRTLRRPPGSGTLESSPSRPRPSRAASRSRTSGSRGAAAAHRGVAQSMPPCSFSRDRVVSGGVRRAACCRGRLCLHSDACLRRRRCVAGRHRASYPGVDSAAATSRARSAPGRRRARSETPVVVALEL